MTIRSLSEHIYTKLNNSQPSSDFEARRIQKSILVMLDKLFTIYPIYWQALTLGGYESTTARNIINFCSSELNKLEKTLGELELELEDISSIINLFIFSQNCHLSSAMKYSADNDYDIHELDTTNFTFEEHKKLLSKLNATSGLSVSLIMPDNLSDELLDLYCKTLSRFHGVVELKLINFSCNIKNAALIESLLEHTPFMIQLPDWDTANDCAEKLEYYKLQNKTQNKKNTYKARDEQLTYDNYPLLPLSQTQTSKRDCINISEAKVSQDRKVYQFSKNISIQQEHQVQIQHQHSHQIQNQRQQEQQLEFQLDDLQDLYSEDESLLITRENIESRFRPYWDYLCRRNAALPGWQSIDPQQDLGKILSKFLGGLDGAKYVASAIQPAALRYIMQRAPQFLNAFVYDIPPAGITFKRSKSNGTLIVCFDKDLEKLNPQNAINPARLPKQFVGNYLQFSAFTSDINEQIILDRHLARRDDNIAVIDSIVDVNCRAILQKWAIANGMGADCAKALFETFTESNAQSLGQLFNSLDFKDYKGWNNKSGTKRWINIVNLIWNEYGADYFNIWKESVLDKSMNWAECIEAGEDIAIQSSINILKNAPNFQELWWQVIQAHSNTCGYTSYARVWDSYYRWMVCIQENQLERYVDIELFTTYMQENSPFDAKAFLDRMIWVLQRPKLKLVSATENSASSEEETVSPVEIQAHILMNIDQIDWGHDGFYYASRYDGYIEWRKNLLFSEFEHASPINKRNQFVTYKSTEEDFTTIKTFARRFASLYLNLTPLEWQRFEQGLNNLAPDELFKPQNCELIITDKEPDDNEVRTKSQIIVSPTNVYFYSHIEKALLTIQLYQGQLEELRSQYTAPTTELSAEECKSILNYAPLEEHIRLSVSLWIRCLACGIDRDNLSDNSKPLPNRLEMTSNSRDALTFIASILPLQESRSEGDFLWAYDKINSLSKVISNMAPEDLRGMNGLNHPRLWVNSLIRVIDSSTNAQNIQDLDHPDFLMGMYYDFQKPYLDIYPWLYNDLAAHVRPCFHETWVRENRIELHELESYKHPCYILLKNPNEEVQTCHYYYYDPDANPKNLIEKEIKLTTLKSQMNSWWYELLSAQREYGRIDYNNSLIHKISYTTRLPSHSTLKANKTYSPQVRQFLSEPREALADYHTHKFSIDRFEQQLKSISCRNSLFFPSAEKIIAAYTDISKNGELARKAIIAEWVQAGYDIREQFASSYLLEKNQQLKNSAIENLIKRLNPLFLDVNRQLFLKLLPYLAYDNEGSIEANQEVLDFINAIQALDRNDSYNELGHLLRMLVRVAAKKDAHHYYAVENLTKWINELTDESKPLFPLNLMETVLSEEIEDCRSILINKDLAHLHSKQRTNLEHIAELARIPNLPSQVKINLAKIAYKNADDLQNILRKWSSKSREIVSHQYLIDVSNIVLQKQDISDDIVEQLTHSISDNTPKYLIDSQETLASLLSYSELSLLQFNEYFRVEKPFTEIDRTKQAILLQAMQQNSTWELFIDNVNQKLRNWNLSELKKLAIYCNKKPKPSMADLNDLVANFKNDTTSLIHHYETQVQTRDKKTNESKRDLSLTPENASDITRIISGIKRKDSTEITIEEKQRLLRLFFYTNAYSLTIQDLDESALISQLHKEAALSRTCIASGYEVTPEAQARILACQREILVRKSGKWCNRMQMIDLLYSAIHNEDGLLHQIRTGGGKSLIALMRMSYRALMGEVVDFYSAKTGLAYRDYSAYNHVLDVMSIDNSYVYPKMDIGDMHYQPTRNGIGAINFGTGSTFILAENKWKQAGILPEGYESKQRGAYVDEFHNVCKDTTQCNSPDDINVTTNAFNPDVWIYEVAYEYFIDNIARFEHNNWTFDNIDDLPGLDKVLRQREVELFSKRSSRLENYVAREDGDKDIQRRDRALTKLLRAAYTAHFLEQDVKSGFSIWENVEKRIGGIDGETLLVNQAKVLIDNQVSEDSTFRDLVHQLLDVRKNKEALAEGKDPLFLVDPVQTVALSQNMLDRLRQYHQRGAKIEGCTATSGRKFLDLRFYEDNFGINHVPKLPNDKPLRTTIHAPFFCRGENEMADALSEITKNHHAQPILALCPDDSSVKFFTKQLRSNSRVISDTNDIKLSENEVIRSKAIADPGVITLSSRMGQGTDIEMSDTLYDKGLVVVTIGTRERLARKQARGRQGRMGFAGDIQDIYDMNAIDSEWDVYFQSHPDLLDKIYQWENRHLHEKMAKHQTRIEESKTTDDEIQNDKWEWATNLEHAEYYLKDRAIALLIEHIEKQEKTHTIAKDRFLNELSQYVGMIINDTRSEDRRKNLKQIWLQCREKIEALWSDHQTGFASYLIEAEKELKTIETHFPNIFRCYSTNPSLDILADFEQALDIELALPEKRYSVEERIADPALPAIQGWLKAVQQTLAPEARATMFGENDEDINKFFIQLSESPGNWLAYFEDLEPVAGMVPCALWTEIIRDTNNFGKYIEILKHFFDLFKNIKDFDIFAAGVRLMINHVGLNSSSKHIKYQLEILSGVARSLERDPRIKRNLLMMSLINIIEKLPVLSEQKEYVHTEFFNNLAFILQQPPFWDIDCTKLYSRLTDVITTNSEVLELFNNAICRESQLAPILMEVYNYLDSASDARIHSLKEYLSENVVQLKEYPEVLVHVFSIILSGNKNVLPPKIQCLPLNLPKDAIITFWEYLSKQNSSSSASLNNVLSWLNEGCTFANIQALHNLPRSISFDYLASQLNFSEENKDGFISLINDTGIAYELFLDKVDNIEHWNNLFLAKNVCFNHFYFNLLSDYNYDNVHLIILEYTHGSNLHEDEVKWILDTGAIISRSEKAPDEEFIRLMIAVLTQEENRNKEFIKGLFSDDRAIGFKLANDSINRLWNIWYREESMTIDRLQWYANIEIKISGLDEDIKYYINSIIDYREDPNLRETFLNELLGLDDGNSINTDKLKNLSLSSLHALWNNFQDGTIQTSAELRQYIDLNILGFQEFKDYMLNAKSRFNITKALREGSTLFSDEKRLQYYNYYHQCFREITNWINWAMQSIGLRAESYKLAYQQLKHLSDEIQYIKSPSSDLLVVDPKSILDLKNYHKNLFNQHKDIYSGFFWSCNRTRINQAKSLFSALDKIEAQDKVEYYTKVLKTITNMQNTIFAGDKSYCFYASNKKGYSRLHHICTELFLSVARDCLCDAQMSADEKLLIQDEHKKQVKEHVILLSQQIKGSLSNSLKGWIQDDSDLNSLSTILCQSSKNEIPNTIHYLYDSLKTMADLETNQDSRTVLAR
ncbi:MAG: hypothetical protein P1U74_09315 [Legionellaceae bacterium]|nr:hypothetical protein [Legionellaceae bacterium]